MAIGEPMRSRPPIGVLRMAGALVFAAFLGASLGLVWQSSGLGDPDPAEQSAGEDGARDEEEEVTVPQSG